MCHSFAFANVPARRILTYRLPVLQQAVFHEKQHQRPAHWLARLLLRRPDGGRGSLERTATGMTSLGNTIIPVTPEEVRERTSAMVVVALLVVAVSSCVLGSGLGFILRAMAVH
jgi:hypothetical protein